MPIPNSFPQKEENQEFSYAFINTNTDSASPSVGEHRRWTEGASLNGQGQFREIKAQPCGQEPQLGPPLPQAHAQTEQLEKAGDKN